MNNPKWSVSQMVSDSPSCPPNEGKAVGVILVLTTVMLGFCLIASGSLPLVLLGILMLGGTSKGLI